MFSPIGLFLDAISDDRLSQQVGRLAALEVPPGVLRAAIAAYVRHYAVDLSEAADPIDSFRTFNEFFTRRLREGTRPICPGETTVASPCDGTVATYGTLADGRLRQIKGRDYELAELVGDSGRAERLTTGRYVTIYLSPRDYHRVHSPVAGQILGYTYIPGRLFPVNAMAVKRVDRLFVVNERLITWIRSSGGMVGVVMVGATSVGQMSASYAAVRTNQGSKARATVELPEPIEIGKGDEIGRFNLGSTVVLLVEDPDVRLSGLTEGAKVRMGEELMARG